MLLTIKNIGKIMNASFKIDGITIIAGDNNTGKSTVGKILYCLYRGFYDIENRVTKSRANAICGQASVKAVRLRTRRITELITDELAKMKAEGNDFSSITASIMDIIVPHLRKDSDNSTLLQELEHSIREAITLSDDDVKRRLLHGIMYSEIGDDICHVNFPDLESTVILNVKNEDFTILLRNNSIESITQPFDLFSQAILIDTPFVLDELSGRWSRSYSPIDHRGELASMLSANEHPTVDGDAAEDFVSRALAERKLKRVYDRISTVSKGKFLESTSGEIRYKEDGLREGVLVSSLSAGLKSFLIIKKLIENGALREKGVLIFDEPEIHLHPEWQLAFAEVIVLLQKEFDLSIVVTTHSAYFLFAIEVFSAKHEIKHKCNYYLAETVEDGMVADFVDVTDNLEPIYAKYFKPFQKLENMRWGNA